MGYSLCIEAIFGNFQNALIFRMLAVFWSRLLHRTTLMCLYKRFSHVLGNFIFCPKLSILHGLQPLDCGHFWPFVKFSRFSNISCFMEPFFAQNISNVFLETFFACLRQFYFFTQTEHFAWAIAFPLWPFLVILKMLSLSKNQGFQRTVFFRRTILKPFQKRFLHVLAILFFDPN